MKWTSGIALALVAILGAGWIYRAELVLFGVAQMKSAVTEVGPTVEIEWSTGTDSQGRAPAAATGQRHPAPRGQGHERDGARPDPDRGEGQRIGPVQHTGAGEKRVRREKAHREGGKGGQAHRRTVTFPAAGCKR